MSNYSKPRLDANELRRQADGRWLSILQYVCPGIFDQAIQKLGMHVTCPFHGGADDFRFVKTGSKGRSNTADTGVAMCTCGVFGDGFALIMRAKGMPFYEALEEVDEYLNGSSLHRAQAPLVKMVRPATTEESEQDAEKVRAKNGKLWASGKEISLKTYYLSRGITAAALEGIKDIRQVSSLPYFQKSGVSGKLERVGNFPAYLVMMRGPDNEPVALHRTWLSRDCKGKAPVTKAKKLTETTGAAGAAMQLHDATNCEVLGLSEGVETALSARSLADLGYWPDLSILPVWPCYSERNIRNFQVPPNLLSTLKRIVIFSDHDKNGIGFTASMEFKARAAIDYPQLQVDIKVPPKVGDDWNDELVSCLKAVDTMSHDSAVRAHSAIASAIAFITKSFRDHPKLVVPLRWIFPVENDWNAELVRCYSVANRIKNSLK